MNTEEHIEKQEKNKEALLPEQMPIDIQKNKETAAAAYFLLLSPVLLFTRKDSAFIQHHAAQAFVLFIIFIVLWFLGSFFTFFSWLTVGVFFACVIGFINAMQGEKYEMPYIYDVVKNGVSFEGIMSGGKKVTGTVMSGIAGALPKESREKMESFIPQSTSSGLEKRVQDLELYIAKEKWFPAFAAIDSYADDQKKSVDALLAKYNAKDTKAEVETSATFYKLTGVFGCVYCGVENGEAVEWGTVNDGEVVFGGVKKKIL